jgi:hypothetical protein
MKKIYLFLFSLIFVSAIKAQVPKNQIQSRINFNIEPRMEAAKIAGDYNAIGSLSGNIVFNNKIYVGGFFSKKVIPIWHTDFIEGQTNDISCQYFGINFGGNIVALKRNESYIIRKTKVRFTFGGRLGGGALWLNNNSWDKISTRDYFYMGQAYLGMFRPMGTFFNFTAGAFFQGTYSLDKLNSYVTNKDFLTPGIYLAFQIKTFK